LPANHRGLDRDRDPDRDRDRDPDPYLAPNPYPILCLDLRHPVLVPRRDFLLISER